MTQSINNYLVLQLFKVLKIERFKYYFVFPIKIKFTAWFKMVTIYKTTDSVSNVWPFQAPKIKRTYEVATLALGQ
jgi:hypothetical protein|tara:strand:- start:1564 stop:1788 length:225 start_codon:yes stop_codon:yes gene_type:complete